MGSEKDNESDDGKDEIFGPKIKILVKTATNLKNVVKFGTIDPYAEITFEHHTKKTKVEDDTKNPKWNEELEFPRGNTESVKVQVKVFHEETLGKDKLLAIGTGTITNYFKSDWHEIEIKLLDSKKRPTEGVMSLGVGGGSEEKGGDEQADEEEDEEDEEESVEGPGGPSGGSKKKKKKKKKRVAGVSAAVEEARAKIDFSSLSTKEETFQVCFTVHKCRELWGHVEAPIVRASLNAKTLRTRKKKGKNPSFSEPLIFSVTKSEKDLLQLPVEISVVDTARKAPFNLIGQYNLDLTVAWSEKDKFLPTKWFALHDPDEPQDGIKGYVNVTIQVVAPGETMKAKPKKDDSEIDIASNVFFPPGVSLQPGQFYVKLFSAEDIPQMDSDKLAAITNFFSSEDAPSQLVDPYIELDFAGSTATSDVRNETFDPVWNQRLILHGSFPSMARNFIIRVKDKDTFSDQTIATKLVKISEISFSSLDADLGFLPTLGPVYLPLYGSLREFTEMKDKYKDLDKGYGDGIAYRGRVLVELTSHMGVAQPGLKDKATIPDTECAIVQAGLRRYKYHLFCSFDSGNMIREKEGQIHFEVSIGEYGNSLSVEGSASPSTTQASHAVYDGTHYYFMPWSSAKPVVILHSEWEDAESRAETFNILKCSINNLEEEVRRYKVIQRAHASDEDLSQLNKQLLMKVLYYLKSIVLPEPKENATQLDINMHKLRLFKIGLLKKEKVEVEEFVGIDLENPGDCVLDLEDANIAAEMEEEERLIAEAEGVEVESKEEEVPIPLDIPPPELPDTPVEFDSFIEEMEWMFECAPGTIAEQLTSQMKLKRVEAIISEFKRISHEPQMSVPDAFVWVLAGTTRLGYTRIPIHKILYTSNLAGRGDLCGKTASYFLRKPGGEKIAAHLALNIWFGRVDHVASGFVAPSNAEVTVMAETYENELKMAFSWTNKMLPRPKFSDINGKFDIPKEFFEAPSGWKFDGDWTVSVDRATVYDPDQGLSHVKETIFELETRKASSSWSNAETCWTDETGEEANARDDVECKDGWEWADEWQQDLDRAVDSGGWEYSEEPDMGTWGPVERSYHLARRRAWMRFRERSKEDSPDEPDPEGWQFAKLPSSKYHNKEKTFDMFRRRAWNRKMISDTPVPVVFSVYKDLDEKKKEYKMAPRILLEYPSTASRRYQLRAYLYQARGVLGADPSGYSDPYARVVFGNGSGITPVIKKSCSPMWDTTVVLDNVELCGDEITSNPPFLVVEIFDEDKLSHDKLGRVVVKPVFCTGTEHAPLKWIPITGTSRSKGEILAAFELYQLGERELPALPRVEHKRYIVPDQIRPQLVRTRIEFLAWGMRDLEDYKMSAVNSPHLEVEIADCKLKLDKIKSMKKHGNFENPHKFIDVMLPVEALYLPPINIRVLDNRNFGYTPLVGVCMMKDYGKYKTSYQALLDLNEHLQKEEESAEKGVSLENTQKPPPIEFETPKEQEPVDVGAIELGEKKKTGSKGKSISTENLLEHDELALKGNQDLEKGPAEEPQTRTMVRKQKQEEETKQHNPDDVLVSDWWSKYYQALGNNPKLERIFKLRNLPKLKLFDRELEESAGYNNFQDLIESIPICKPDNEISSDSESEDEEDETRHRVGYFKGSLKMYEITEELHLEGKKDKPKLLFSNLPTNKCADVLVRVYVAAATGLTPLDFGGSADPYLVVKCGKTAIYDKDNYQVKELNPVFGRMFQIRAKLPRDSKLTVKVYDNDLLGGNDLIGQTTLDIEDRFLSWRRASCGLPQRYIKTRGSKDRWRDSLKPIDLLKRMCLLKGWINPLYKRDAGGLKVVVGGETHSLETSPGAMKLGGSASQAKSGTSERNDLALQVLLRLGAVPEHVETRTLYNEDCPGIPQGKLHMWVDIFSYGENVPPPLNIAPRQPSKFTLRCIIYNTEDVILDDTNILGDQMSDIYIKTFLEGRKGDSQETDVHYRSLTGEGNFNWRMVFELDFILQENKMVQTKKGKFWDLEKKTYKVDPIFHLKMYDKDVLSRDDLLGWAEFDLTRVPAPTKTAGECDLSIYEDESKHPRMSLFEKKKMQGFWPVFDDSLGTRELTGKVEMELELLTEEEAIAKPAGVAREEPNLNPTLAPPNRPETSFNWFTNPWKVFKMLIWRRYKWKMLIALIIFLALVFLGLLLWSAPGAINDAIWSGDTEVNVSVDGK